MRKNTTQGPRGWELKRTGKGPVLDWDGRISSKDSYALERRVIKESVGQPSVSRSKIAAAAREIVRSSQRRVS